MVEFKIRQPLSQEITSTDKYYLDIANNLLKESETSEFGRDLPEAVLKRISLCITGYFQDIISDAGVFRSFVNANRELYGWSIPFHETGESYIDYELNKEDVRFLVWYSLAMEYEDMRDVYPHSSKLLEMADKLYDYLNSIYEESPIPENYNITINLDLSDPEDKPAIYQLVNWLFLRCYLLTPAFALTLSEIMSDPELKKEENIPLLEDRLESAMSEFPTGPLALFISEWVELIVTGKLKKETSPSSDKIHPYFDKFVKATDGNTIAFFATYKEMNDFFIEALGWEKGVEHLPMMKVDKDFVLMVNKQKGMLVARNVAACISAPGNVCYNKEYASTHAFNLLSERALCPGDLLREILKNGWLPDARFPGTEDTVLVKENADFIARCYLQLYYTGD